MAFVQRMFNYLKQAKTQTHNNLPLNVFILMAWRRMVMVTPIILAFYTLDQWKFQNYQPAELYMFPESQSYLLELAYNHNFWQGWLTFLLFLKTFEIIKIKLAEWFLESQSMIMYRVALTWFLYVTVYSYKNFSPAGTAVLNLNFW